MGGMALGALTAGQMYVGVQAGKAQAKAGEAAALQAGLEAKSAELGRRQDLQDALAMQAVITGAGGRAAGEGSVVALRKADIKRSKEDVAMIKAGGKARAAGARAAGYSAQATSLTGGLLQAGLTGYQATQVK
jgi:hypothetical protein